ncbi:YolD-like family protein [Ammoniphilus sp. CFH 90114]|uniref:YolD-like family protein n=1 Tax=Ammoniphilus sp. CFH 90114 TaxID=2493665 RepID=UPI00100ED691|nr:YolD-like family protein [Ammoniphilus sp. CFH 90114]RXT07842.1 YolD-like family protein [Ammoniphilus sp. CFH 90114]
MDNLRDRGNIKWSTMMLPEHRKLLQQLELSQEEESCPELTEDRWEEIQYIIQEAMGEGVEVTLTFFADKRFKHFTGKVKKFDPLRQTLHVVGEDEYTYPISVASLVDAVHASRREFFE